MSMDWVASKVKYSQYNCINIQDLRSPPVTIYLENFVDENQAGAQGCRVFHSRSDMRSPGSQHVADASRLLP